MQQTHRFILGQATGGQAQVRQDADFVIFQRVIGAPVLDSVRVKVDGQDLGVFSPGDYLKMPRAGTAWEFILNGTPTGSGAIYVFKLAKGLAGSLGVEGVVSIAAAGSRRSLLGGQMMGVSEGTSAAAEFPYCICLSGAGGAAMSVQKLWISSTVAQKVSVWRAQNSGLRWPLGNLNQMQDCYSASPFQNQGYLVTRFASLTGTPQAVPANIAYGDSGPLWTGYCPANTPVQVDLLDAIVFQVAVEHIGVYGHTANSTLAVTFQGELMR